MVLNVTDKYLCQINNCSSLITKSTGRTDRVLFSFPNHHFCVDIGEAFHIPSYIGKASFVRMYSMTQPDNVYPGPPTKLVKLEPSILFGGLWTQTFIHTMLLRLMELNAPLDRSIGWPLKDLQSWSTHIDRCRQSHFLHCRGCPRSWRRVH